MGSKSNTDFKGLTDWVEVFRAGTHKDSIGRTHTFSRAQLDEIVANVSAAAPAPHVITHKELYSPFRYGSVVAAKRDGDSLFVKSDQIEPQFERLVADGRLRDRSIRLRRTENGLALSHVAWLGAEPPAVEGMAPVQFAASSDQVMDFSYDDARSAGLLARALRRMREFLIDKYSVDDADRVMPEWEVQAADALYAQALAEPEAESTSETTANPMFAAPAPGPQDGGDMTAEELAKLQADLDAANARIAEFARNEEASARAVRVAEFGALVTGAIDAGRLTPAQALGMAEFAAGLAAAQDAEFEFSAGDTTAKKSPYAWFTDFVASLGKQIDFGESDAGRRLDGQPADFSAPSGFGVDEAHLDLHRRVQAHRVAHPNLTYQQALAAVGTR